MNRTTQSLPIQPSGSRIHLSMRRGTFARGRSLDPGVRLTVADAEGIIIATETLWCGVRYDAYTRNRLGQLGAYVTVWPLDATVRAVALRLIDEHGVTEIRDRRLIACGVPQLVHVDGAA